VCVCAYAPSTPYPLAALLALPRVATRAPAVHIRSLSWCLQRPARSPHSTPRQRTARPPSSSLSVAVSSCARLCVCLCMRALLLHLQASSPPCRCPHLSALESVHPPHPPLPPLPPSPPAPPPPPLPLLSNPQIVVSHERSRGGTPVPRAPRARLARREPTLRRRWWQGSGVGDVGVECLVVAIGVLDLRPPTVCVCVCVRAYACEWICVCICICASVSISVMLTLGALW